MTPTAAQLEAFAGKVISEHPYVKLLAAPHYYEEECVPGLTKGEWRALAQVNESLCVITVNITCQSD